MEIRRAIISRLGVIYFLMFALGVIVVFKLVTVQNIKTERWKQIADNLNKNTVIIEANRGNICADDGSVLATSVPGYIVRIDLAAPGVKKVYGEESDALAQSLAEMFPEKTKWEHKKRLDDNYKKGNRGLKLTPRKIDYLELQKIKQFPILRRGQYGGGRIIEQENTRIVPLGILASRTIGELSKSAYGITQGSIGYTGIEGAYEPFLKGEQGVSYKQNLSGRWVNRTEIEPKDGMDIFTTLNVKLQDITENALYRQLEKTRAEWGTAILMEVKTGKVKAIANLGRVDDDYYDEIYNYALGHAGNYEPGSTFKLMSLVVAMEQGLVDTSDVFDTENGSWKHYDKIIYDSDYGRGEHGEMTVRQIFERSSNVGVAKIITHCYADNPKDYIDRLYNLGLNKPLGLEIKGEGIPYFKYPGERNWWGTSLAWMSYGYEIKMTPLQILTFYNAIANDGKMVKPQLVEKIMDEGVLVKNFETEVMNPMIVSEETLGKAKDMLEGVCETGTGKRLSNNIFKMAGKTGTAQIAVDGSYAKGLYLSSFAGYFPADDPEYSIMVTVNKPRSGIYYGGSVAGPVFKEMAEKIYALKIQPAEYAQNTEPEKSIPKIKSGKKNDIEEVIEQLELEEHLVQADANTEFVKTGNKEGQILVTGNKIPDVRGMGAANAIYLLESKGLKVKISGIGKVKKQAPVAGSSFRKGQTVYLALS